MSDFYRNSSHSSETLKFTHTLYIGLILIISIIMIWAVWPSVSGDASIYEVFWQQFFNLPFSFQKNETAFGATSPFHVIIMSLPWHLGGLSLVKTVAFFLLMGSALYTEKSLSLASGKIKGIFLLTLLAFPVLWEETSKGFESFWGCIWGMLYITFTIQERRKLLLALYSIAPLIRPELILISTTAIMLSPTTMQQRIRWLALSLQPLIIYHLYMAVTGAGWIPSSVWERGMRTIGGELSWNQLSTKSWGILFQYSPQYHVGIAIWLLAILKFKNQPIARKLLISFLPILLLYIVFPANYFMPRYLIPILPAIAYSIFLFIHAIENKKLGMFLTLTLLISPALTLDNTHRMNRFYDRDGWLLNDLTTRLNPLLDKDDSVLLYEVQSQLNMQARVVSADGVVGKHARAYLKGTQSFEDFVEQENIQWIVTMNAFNYRTLYKNTELHKLYEFDLRADIGSTFTTGEYTWEKIISNPIFSNPDLHSYQAMSNLNSGNSIRIFNDKTPQWSGAQILWNSVYKRKP